MIRLLSCSPAAGTMKFKNIVVFPEWKLAYIGIPKAANTSIKRWLLPLIGKPDEHYNNIHRDDVGFSYSDNEWLAEHKDEYFVFTVVRNPWARAYSTYKDKVVRKVVHGPLRKLGFTEGMSFRDFLVRCNDVGDDVADVHIRSQWSMVIRKGLCLTNLIIKTESLDSQIGSLKSFITTTTGCELAPFPWENRKTDGDYRGHYSGDMKDLVRKRYERDVAFFGYEF